MSRCFAASIRSAANTWERSEILNSYTYPAATSKAAVFPLGGIGAGSIGLGADGRLQDWEIFNRPAKGSVNGFSHFAVRAEQSGRVLDTRILQGPFAGDLTGSHLGPRFNGYGFGPRRQQMAGFPGFENVSLTGPYPVADLRFEDDKFPGRVTMRALSPFIPMESRLSSMPVAMFELTVENTGREPLDYALIGCIGHDIKDPRVEAAADKGLQITSRSAVETDKLEYAELSLATDHAETSYQRHFYRGSWFDALEVYWADISRAGLLKDRFYTNEGDRKEQSLSDGIEHSVMASHITVPAGESRTVRMALGWYVPNMSKYWVSQNSPLCCEPKNVAHQWRNYYATVWSSAAEVTTEALQRWDEVVDRTLNFRSVLADTTMPDAIVDAVSANLSILKSPTVLRLEDGTFYGFEGCHDDAGCCEGSCTHVWNYQQALPFLFPDLERSMREADFAENQSPETGGMAFRLALPKGIGRYSARACADGHFGNVMKAFRDWKLSGDQDWLKKIWPNVKAAVEFAWHPDNHDLWDPKKTGVLWGRQHHTLDMELYGPNSWLTGFYLGALSAAAKMADAVGDADAAADYLAVFERGYAWVDEKLFNGRWFFHEVDVSDREILAPFLIDNAQAGIITGDVYQQYWSDEHGEIKYQLGEGCAIDQVLAEWHARLYGLDTLFDEDKFASAVRKIFDNNFVERLGDIPNPCRVFGQGDESGTLISSWPEGVKRPAIPLPYAQETMHGFEYAFGCQLMMIGEIEKGTRVFAAVRDRYQGHNRNPWNEIECGSNYARSMASYAAVPVLSGFTFDAGAGQIGFAPKVEKDGKFQSLWSNGTAWGQVTIAGGKLQLRVMGGRLSLSQLSINGKHFDANTLLAQPDARHEEAWAIFEAGSAIELAIPEGGKHSGT